MRLNNNFRLNSAAFNFLKCTLIFLFLTPTIFFASGRLKGTAVDSLSRDALIGASVVLIGTAYGTSVDIDGSFELSGIPAGNYKIRCSYIGYISKESQITINDNETKTLDFELLADAIEGKTIIVSAQAVGQAAAINKQLSSNTITNVVSLDRILEIPDANAAESVGRLPGISILREGGEGNKVTIRGLAPTYNAVTIGGDKIPSTDFNDRSVDMSMISSEILAGIEVMKALTADQEADVIGGAIEFKLAEAPKGGFKYNLRAQNGYNKERSEYGQYRASLTMSNRFFEEKFGLMITANAERVQRGSDQFRVSYEMLREKREDEEYAPLSASGVRYEYINDIRKRLGFTVLMDFQLGDGKILFNNFLSRLDRDKKTQERRFALSSNYQYHNWFDERSQIDIMTNSLSGEHNLSLLKVDWRLSRSESYSRLPFNNIMHIREMSAFDYTKLNEIRTPESIIAAAKNNLDNTQTYEAWFDSEKSLERDLAAQINVQMPFTITEDIAGKIKAGAKYKDKLKERDRGSLSSRLDDPIPELAKHHTKYGQPGFIFKVDPGTGNALLYNYIKQGATADNFLNGKYDFGLLVDGDELNHVLTTYLLDSLYNYSNLRDIDDYESTERISAGYAMAEINFGQYLMFLPGIRYEKTSLNMTGRKGSVPDDYSELPLDSPPQLTDTSRAVSFSNWFPMIHLKFKPTEWFDLRLAYTKTISRPRLDYLLPKIKVDGTAKVITMGRPTLQPQISSNIDAYASFYGNKIGLLAGGVFYKGIDNLIYERSGHMIFDPAKDGYDPNWKGYTLTIPENTPHKTTVYGVETEWQTNFKWMPKPFDGLVLNINYTHVWSETKYPRSFVRKTRIPTFPFIKNEVIDTFRVGKMVNQANDIANVSLGYDLGGFSGRISVLFQGKTLYEVGEREELDNYTDDYIRWDLMMKYDFTDNIGVYLNLNNFTNSADKKYALNTHFMSAEEYYDWTADLGINIKLR